MMIGGRRGKGGGEVERGVGENSMYAVVMTCKLKWRLLYSRRKTPVPKFYADVRRACALTRKVFTLHVPRNTKDDMVDNGRGRGPR